MLQMYKGVRNNEIIPVTEVAIDAAKQSAIRSFGVQAVYSTRMQTKRRPRLVSLCIHTKHCSPN